MTEGLSHLSGQTSPRRLARHVGGLALALLLVGPAAPVGADDAAVAQDAASGAVEAAAGQEAGGADLIWGSWKTDADRTGVTVFHGQDGSLRIVTSYYEVDLPAEFVERGVSFCYDDEISANAWDSRRADDTDTWRYLAGHLQITTDDQFTWGGAPEQERDGPARGPVPLRPLPGRARPRRGRGRRRLARRRLRVPVPRRGHDRLGGCGEWPPRRGVPVGRRARVPRRRPRRFPTTWCP